MTCMNDDNWNHYEGLFAKKPDSTWDSNWSPHRFERHKGRFGEPDRIVKKNWMGEVVHVRRDYFA